MFIITCDQAEIIIDQILPRENKAVSEFYYLLPEKFLTCFIQLEASYLNPFIERLQYYMDLSFQAGLPYIWEVFMSYGNPYKKIMRHTDDLTYLKFEDLAQVFSILIVGYAFTMGKN